MPPRVQLLSDSSFDNENPKVNTHDDGEEEN
jgi:hypothetical protein